MRKDITKHTVAFHNLANAAKKYGARGWGEGYASYSEFHAYLLISPSRFQNSYVCLYHT